MRGAVAIPDGFRIQARHGVIGAGWRRAYRLTGRGIQSQEPAALGSSPAAGIDIPVALQELEASPAPEQPPSSLEIPALEGFAPELPDSGLCAFLRARAAAANPGCGVIPCGSAL